MAFKPHKYQQIALDSKSRYIACLSGVQGGKTTLGAVWLLREIQEAYNKGQKGDWIIAAPTVKILNQSTLVKFKAFFPKAWGTWKESRSCFELAWGDTIFVRSTDSPDGLEGITALGAWLDEAGQMKSMAWTNIQGRLSINRGRAIITTTPYATNWLHREIYKKAGWMNGEATKAETRDKDIAVVCWHSVDNPSFPRDEYERQKKSMSKELFERRYDGQFTRMEGLVYGDFTHETCVVESFPLPAAWKRFSGLDFGHNNPTAGLKIAQKPAVEEDTDNAIPFEPSIFYVYGEFYKRKPLLREIAEWLNIEELSYTLGDPSSAQEIDELRRAYGVKRIISADNSIEIGIERIKSLLKEGRLKFFKGRCPNAIAEIEEYHYAPPDPDRPVSDKPVAVHNHAMDALKYAFSRSLDGLYVAKAGVGNYKMRNEKREQVRARLARAADPITGYF